MVERITNVVNYVLGVFPFIGFVLWFTIDTLTFYYYFFTRTILNFYDQLGLGAILKHFFAPFRRDKTLVGYMVGITIRIVWTMVSSVLIALLFLVALVLPIFYYYLPYFLYTQNPYLLLPYIVLLIFVYWLVFRNRRFYHTIKQGNLTNRSVRKLLWKRLALAVKKTDLQYQESINNADMKPFYAYLHTFRLNEHDFESAKTWVLNQVWNRQGWQFWRNEFFIRSEGVNKGWFAGFLPELKKYSVDLTEQAAQRRLPRVYGREKELSQIMTTLVRPRKNNVLVVGSAGVGKRSLIYEVAWLLLGTSPGLDNSRTKEDNSTIDLVKLLSGRRIIELDTAGLIGGSGRGNVEARLRRVLTELEAGETILFINQVENLINEGLIGYITPLLSSHSFPIVATTTPEVFRKYIENYAEFVSEFDVLTLTPPGISETMEILERIVMDREKKSHVFFTYQALSESIELSERYIHKAVLPSKAIDVLQKAVEVRQDKIITVSDVQSAVSAMTGVPVGELSTQEADKLLSLERLLSDHIIGQKDAITTIARAMRRARTGVSSASRPIASFLFLGPTGVGKTLTAKVLAQVYFTPTLDATTSEAALTKMVENNFVRFDMSEFAEFGAIVSFISQMTTLVNERPFSLILLDEFEKAENKIHNLFLQILEDGRLTSEEGQTVDFRNTIIIATSNAVTDMQVVTEEDGLLLRERLEAKFPPELINRFDGLVMFERISKNDMSKIVVLELSKLKKRLQSQHEISLSWTVSLVNELARLGYDEDYGARPLRRIIQDRLEEALAQKLLRKELQYGDSYELGVLDLNK